MVVWDMPRSLRDIYGRGSFHGIVAGYSYELYTSSIDPGNGSHELFVGYKIDINLVKKERINIKALEYFKHYG